MTYDVAGARRRRVHVRVHRPPQHDRDAHRGVTPPGEQICYTDAYARSVEARVRHVEAGDAPLVVLDRTVFYPGGGGQPSDRGLLLRGGRRPRRGPSAVPARPVARSSTSSSRTAANHRPSATPSEVDLDWARRLALMRTHTALHALCGVVWRDHGAQVTGGNMEPGAGRMDFEFESMTGDLVDSIEATVNTELAAERDVRVNVLPRAEAFAIPDLIRTKINLLPEGIERDPDDRDRRPRPAGRRRHPRRQHPRGRSDPRDRLRVEGPHQQAHPHRARRSGVAARRILEADRARKGGEGVGWPDLRRGRREPRPRAARDPALPAAGDARGAGHRRHRPDDLPDVHEPRPHRLPELRQGARRLLPVDRVRGDAAQLDQPGRVRA